MKLPDKEENKGKRNIVMKRIFLVYPNVVVCIILFLLSFPLSANESLLYLRKGSQAEMHGKFEEALNEYKKALDKNPNLVSLYNTIGHIYSSKLKDNKKAIEIYLKGLEIFPNDFFLTLNIMKTYFYVVIIFFFFIVQLHSTDKSEKNSLPTLQKPQSNSDIWLDVNRFRGVFRNNGIWFYDVIGATQGTEWPQGSGHSPIFAGGQWISAKVNGEVRVAGIQHSATEYQPGMILSPGIADNWRNTKYQWYVLRSSGYDDRTRWPVDQGAPIDENGEPKLYGDMTIFSVWNDLTSHDEFGTNPLGIEVRQTAFALQREFSQQ